MRKSKGYLLLPCLTLLGITAGLLVVGSQIYLTALKVTTSTRQLQKCWELTQKIAYTEDEPAEKIVVKRNTRYLPSAGGDIALEEVQLTYDGITCTLVRAKAQ